MIRQGALIYPRFERFWHWAQAALVLFLGLTGFEIHGSIGLLGFGQAVAAHIAAAAMLIVLSAFAIFWHATTGEWRQYLPTRRLLREQCRYYLVGIFDDAPHPTCKTREAKLNPLQRIVYGQLKLVVLPVVMLSGLLYYLYRYPGRHGVAGLDVHGLATIAAVHTAAAFVLLAFAVVHVYLTTTGVTLTSHLRAMITGYEPVEHERRNTAIEPASAPGRGTDLTEPTCEPGI